ncbi:MAG: MATE family efflux transporter [Phycisphaerae bacterium]
MRINRYLTGRWREEGGYHEVLVIALPLILSTGSWSVQHFVDRMFLTWYSPEAIAASMPAGLLNFTVMSLFIGTASYVGTFVAQYYGARRYEKVGPAIWQGIYVAMLGAVVAAACIPFAGVFFRWIGHGGLVEEYETIFFQVLCLGAGPVIASSAMSGFFSGLGKTWVVMWVNIFATLVTLVGDYLLVFGHGGFPRLGIMGAGIATVLSAFFSFSVYLILFYRRSYNEKYHLLKGWRFDRAMFGRLLYFGFPNGVQFFLDVAGFTAFLFFIGRLGTTSLAATNIAFNINTLAFMPMLGFGIATSILVGQNLGANRPGVAEKSVYSCFHITFAYMAMVALLFAVVPDLFIDPFAAQAQAKDFAQIRQTTIVLLRFVAVYSIFDTLNIIFASALRGAGDTRYVMIMIVFISSLVLVAPSYIAMIVLKKGIYTGWTIASAYVIILGFSFLFRFLGGKWKSMRVIEESAPSFPSTIPETPTMEIH